MQILFLLSQKFNPAPTCWQKQIIKFFGKVGSVQLVFTFPIYDFWHFLLSRKPHIDKQQELALLAWNPP